MDDSIVTTHAADLASSSTDSKENASSKEANRETAAVSDGTIASVSRVNNTSSETPQSHPTNVYEDPQNRPSNKKSSLDELTNEIFGSSDLFYSTFAAGEVGLGPALPFSNAAACLPSAQQHTHPESPPSIKHILAFSPEDLQHTKHIKNRIEVCQERQLRHLYNTEIFKAPSVDPETESSRLRSGISAKELILSLLPFHLYNREDSALPPHKYDPGSSAWNSLSNAAESTLSNIDSVLHVQRLKQLSPLELQMIEKRLFLEEEKYIFSYLQQEFFKRFGISYKSIAATSAPQSAIEAKSASVPMSNRSAPIAKNATNKTSESTLPLFKLASVEK